MDLDVCPVMLVEEVCDDGGGYGLVGGHGGGGRVFMYKYVGLDLDG